MVTGYKYGMLLWTMFLDPSNTPISCDYPWEHNLLDSIATQLTIRWLADLLQLDDSSPCCCSHLFFISLFFYTYRPIYIYIYRLSSIHIYLKKKKQLCGA